MLKFKSLPLAGESLLITDENNRRNYLIDAGGNRRDVLKHLPRNIDIAICTHNDSDHANGFIGILNKKSINIREMWLPAIWQPLIGFILENFYLYNFFKQFGRKFSVHDNYNEEYDYESSSFYNLTTVDGKTEKIDEKYLHTENGLPVDLEITKEFMHNSTFKAKGHQLLSINKAFINPQNCIIKHKEINKDSLV